ncbi:MAG: RedB protein [Planctomycetota bacterium]
MFNTARRSIATLIIFVWLLANLSGLWAVGFFTSQAQEQSSMAPDAPVREDRDVLLLFAHPHCPCFAASLKSFAEIVRSAGDQQRAEIIFVRPDDVASGWERTPSWDAAMAIPGVRVSCDTKGERAKGLGATTSGQVLYIDAGGAVRFRGGITRPGSHAGDNVGRRSLINLLNGQDAEQNETKVYGCLLY